MRLGAALAHTVPGCPTPLYRFMFSDMFTFGFPPETYALDAHLRLLNEAAPGAPWMAAGLRVDIRPLIPAVVSRGGHIRVGLEEAPFDTALTNIEWVGRERRDAHRAGRRSPRGRHRHQASSILSTPLTTILLEASKPQPSRTDLV